MDRIRLIAKCGKYADRQDSRHSLALFSNEFKKFFSAFPDNVIEQWPFRHFHDFTGEYRWKIEYERLNFTRAYVSTELIEKIEAENFNADDLLEMGKFHLNDDEPVALFQKRNGTFIQPIILLNSVQSNLDGEYEFKSPWHLLEGHRRTWLLRGLVDSGKYNLLSQHEVWMVTRI